MRAGLVLAIVIAGCGRSEDAQKKAVDAGIVIARPPVLTDASIDAEPPPPPSRGTGGVQLRYSETRNLEMVPYCFAYPSTLFRESTEKREHGTKAFVPIASFVPKAQEAHYEVSPTCGPRKLAKLFADDEAQIRKANPGVRFSEHTIDAGTYALGWRAGDRVHYGKMWATKDDPQCFVRALLDYDAREERLYAPVVAALATATLVCAD